MGVTGEAVRLRFVFSAGTAESLDEVEVLVVSEVLAVEGFWVDVACKVSLESLGVLLSFLVTLDGDVVWTTVGVRFGAWEKSSSSDSLSEELVPEEDDDVDATAVEATVFFGDSSVDSSVEVVLEDELGLATIKGIPTSPPLNAAVFVFAFFEGDDPATAAGMALDPESVESEESEPELVESLEAAFRLRFLTGPLVADVCDAADACNGAPAGSFSSSASLSALELVVDEEGDFAFDALAFFLAAFSVGIVSVISTSNSLSLPPLLLVSSLALTLAAASSLAFALAFACFLDFFDFLAVFVSSLSSLPPSLLLLLVSSIFVRS